MRHMHYLLQFAGNNLCLPARGGLPLSSIRTMEILQTAVSKLINAYISGTLRTVFRNPTFLIHMEKKLVPLGRGLPLRGKA
jgi:hypothetical protein